MINDSVPSACVFGTINLALVAVTFVTAIVVLAPPTAAVNVTFNEPVKLVPVIV